MKRFSVRTIFKGKDSFARNTSIYLVSNLLNAAIPFFLLPILTRFLTPAEYGIIGMFQIMLGIFAAFIGFSAPGSAARKYFDRNEGIDLAAYIGACIQLLTISTLLVLLAVILMAEPLVAWTGLPRQWLMIAVVVACANLFIQLRLVLWQVRNHSVKYGILQVSQSLLNLFLSLFLVVAVSGGWQGRLWGISLPLVCFGLLAVYLLVHSGLLKVAWRPDYIRQLLSFGVPLLPASVGLLLLGATDRFLINHFLGLSEVGVYMVAAQLSLAMILAVDAIMKAYVPWLYGRLKEGDPEVNRRVVNITYLYFGGMLCTAAVFAVLAPWIVPWLAGPDYERAGALLSWMIFGVAFVAMQLPLGAYIFYSERTASQSVITLFAGVIHVGLVYWLVPAHGITGAAMAGIASSAVRFLMTWRAAHRLHPMPWFSSLSPVAVKHG